MQRELNQARKRASRRSDLAVTPLVDVDDRGVFFEDSFSSWREHIQQVPQSPRRCMPVWIPTKPPHVGVLLQNTPFFSHC